jgi:prefoldin subunit 5
MVIQHVQQTKTEAQHTNSLLKKLNDAQEHKETTVLLKEGNYTYNNLMGPSRHILMLLITEYRFCARKI